MHRHSLDRQAHQDRPGGWPVTDYEELEQSAPASISAERTILGAILLDSRALDEATEKLLRDDFSLDSHRLIYHRMTEMGSSGRPVDLVTLMHELGKHKEIESIGGVSYLASLTEGLPRRPVIDEYIRIVKDKSLLRRLMSICSAGAARASDQSETALHIIGSIADQIKDIELAGVGSEDLESVGQWLDKNDIFAERNPGLFTGIDQYDELTYGFHPGELTIIAARTSMGKTSMACTLTWSIARRGKAIAVFINEQRKASFMGRMLCGQSSVSFKSYSRNQLDWVEKQYIQDAVREFKMLPIFWDERSSMSLASIRGKARRLQRSGDLDLIIVDQLTGINNEGIDPKMRSDEKFGFKARALKAIGMDLGVPVILFHQLSRETIKNEGSRPGLQNLKNSGELEEAADVVSFLHRPSYYDQRDEGLKRKDEWIIGKGRDIETGVAQVEFVPECCKWRNRR
jgi:replicative DNA helicase